MNFPSINNWDIHSDENNARHHSLFQICKSIKLLKSVINSKQVRQICNFTACQLEIIEVQSKETTYTCRCSSGFVVMHVLIIILCHNYLYYIK